MDDLTPEEKNTRLEIFDIPKNEGSDYIQKAIGFMEAGIDKLAFKLKLANTFELVDKIKEERKRKDCN